MWQCLKLIKLLFNRNCVWLFKTTLDEDRHMKHSLRIAVVAGGLFCQCMIVIACDRARCHHLRRETERRMTTTTPLVTVRGINQITLEINNACALLLAFDHTSCVPVMPVFGYYRPSCVSVQNPQVFLRAVLNVKLTMSM